MFERFTKEARSAVTAAQQIARGMNHGGIDTGHLLLALYAEPAGAAHRSLAALDLDPADLRRRVKNTIDGLDPEALAMIGIDLDRVREATEASFGPGALDASGPVKSGHIPFKPESKKALELSLRQAIKNKDTFICGGHVLLGLLMLPDCTAARVLRECRVNTESLKVEITREIAADAA
ncbi:Clp protease N-terminal domain-containing protein [Actinocorallia longicatena]|uniref:Clp R domain-containing protein n=1 Tax=Actinocorallia longicatena TaxID=111803 RepID=A0ABP6QAQ3_9ACTN